MAPRHLDAQKQTYRPSQKLEVFYTGGAARITRDGKLLVCTCGDEIKDSDAITALAVSPDSKTLVAASRSLNVRVYDLITGELQRTWRAHKSPVADMAIDASGGYVATASADRIVKVWDVQGGFCTHSFTGHSGVVMKVLFHPKQMQLYTAGDDNDVRVWDLVDKSCVAILKGHFSAVTSLALSPDGWTLLSGARDKVVIAWDLRTNTKITTIPVYEAVEGLVSLPIGAPFPGVDAPQDATVKGAAKKVVHFATAGDKGQLKLWRSDTGTCSYSQPLGTADTDRRLEMSKQLVGNIDEVTDVRFIGDKEAPTHIAVANNSETLRLFDIETLSCTASLTGHKEIVLCMDAAQLTSGLAPPSLSASLTGHKEIVMCMDAAQLTSGKSIIFSGGKDNEVRLWDCSTASCVAVGVGHVAAVSSLVLSRKPARKFAVSAGADKLLKVWDLEPAIARLSAPEGGADPKGGPLQLRVSAAVSAHDKDINSVALAPNDQLVATGSQDRTVKIWRLPDLVQVLTLRGHKRGVWSVEFSSDKTIKMWSVQDGSCLRTLEGHQATVLRATFVSAGTQILSCAADGLVKLWSAKSGECVNTFDHHNGKIWAMTTAGKGESLLATGGNDSLVAIWKDCTEEDIQAEDQAEEELVEKEQALSNALMDEDFAEAARLAFDLKHPRRLLSVVTRAASSRMSKALMDEDFAEAARLAFDLKHLRRLLSVVQRAASSRITRQQNTRKAVAVVTKIEATAARGKGGSPKLIQLVPLKIKAPRCASKGGSGAGSDTSRLLQGLVSHLSTDDLKTALEYCREWNTNSRNCHAAQAMLQAILRCHTPKALAALPGCKDLVSALMVYTQRHFTRMDRLLRSSFLMEYTLASMKVLDPEGDLGGEDMADDEDAMLQPLPFTALLGHTEMQNKRPRAGGESEDEFSGGIESGPDEDEDEDMDEDEDGDDGGEEEEGKKSSKSTKLKDLKLKAPPSPVLAAAGTWSGGEESAEEDSLPSADESGESSGEEAANNAGNEDDMNNNDNIDELPGWGGEEEDEAWSGGDEDQEEEEEGEGSKGTGKARARPAGRIGAVKVLKLRKLEEDDGPGTAQKRGHGPTQTATPSHGGGGKSAPGTPAPSSVKKKDGKGGAKAATPAPATAGKKEGGKVGTATTPAPSTAGKKSKAVTPAPSTAGKKIKATTPAPSAAVKKSEAVTPAATPAGKKSKATTPAPSTAVKKSEAVTPAATPAGKKSKATTPAPSTAVKKSEAVTPAATPAGKKSKATTPVPSTAVKKSEAVTPAATPAGKKSKATTPAPTTAGKKSKALTPAATPAAKGGSNKGGHSQATTPAPEAQNGRESKKQRTAPATPQPESIAENGAAEPKSAKKPKSEKKKPLTNGK
eukprot:gene2643-5017_t